MMKANEFDGVVLKVSKRGDSGAAYPIGKQATIVDALHRDQGHYIAEVPVIESYNGTFYEMFDVFDLSDDEFVVIYHDQHAATTL